jgi:acyl-CoA synthetase (AMP-forming)/AMP-acid ligase II
MDFYSAFFGASLAGAIPVALYPPFRLGRLDEYHARTTAQLEESGARLLVTSRRMARLLDRSSEEAKLDLGLVTIEDIPNATPTLFDPSADRVALIQFSSGSTREPEAVRLSHREILANVDAIREVILRAYPESAELTHRGVSWLPLYHDMGLVGSVFTSLAHPSDLVLIPPEYFVHRPAIWLRAISRYRATVSAAPNFAYGLCADRIQDHELEGVDLSNWCLALNGAEPVAPSVLRRFQSRFRSLGFRESALTPVYGLSEAGLAVTFAAPERMAHTRFFDRDALADRGLAEPSENGLELASVGKPLPGYRLRIADSKGRAVGSQHLGRVLVSGPSIPADLTREGWLDTGDRGFLFDDELYLYGRNKDLIVLRGRNYAPQDIELALDDLPHVRKGCTAALGVVPESGEREELVILVERNRASPPSVDPSLAQAVRDSIASRIGVVPDAVRVVEPGTLPRTSNGKIRRAEARRRYLAGDLTAPRRWPRWQLTGELFRSFSGRPGKRPAGP